MLKIRGKIIGQDGFSEVVLYKGQMEGDTDLVLLIKQLSAEYEAYGTIPVLNYHPTSDEYWKDEFALLYMVNQICTNVQTNQAVAVPDIMESMDGVDY